MSFLVIIIGFFYVLSFYLVTKFLLIFRKMKKYSSLGV